MCPEKRSQHWGFFPVKMTSFLINLTPASSWFLFTAHINGCMKCRRKERGERELQLSDAKYVWNIPGS